MSPRRCHREIGGRFQHLKIAIWIPGRIRDSDHITRGEELHANIDAGRSARILPDLQVIPILARGLGCTAEIELVGWIHAVCHGEVGDPGLGGDGSRTVGGQSAISDVEPVFCLDADGRARGEEIGYRPDWRGLAWDGGRGGGG